MFKAIIIIVVVAAVLIGGMLALRSSRQHGNAERGRAEARRGARAPASGQGRGRALGACQSSRGLSAASAPTPRCLPHLARQGEQVAVPPAILGAAMLAIHRLPAHADFLQHADRRGVVHIDGGNHPLRAQIEKCRIDQGQRNFGRDIPCPTARRRACSPNPRRCSRSTTDRRPRSACPRRFPRRPARIGCAAARAAMPAAPRDIPPCSPRRGVRKKDSG